MEKVCKKYGDKLNIKDGKLAVEKKEDIDTILKMLADYYKTGDVLFRARKSNWNRNAIHMFYIP